MYVHGSAFLDLLLLHSAYLQSLHRFRGLTRAKKNEVNEIILATNATVDGQTTAHYIAEVYATFSE